MAYENMLNTFWEYDFTIFLVQPVLGLVVTQISCTAQAQNVQI